MDDEFNSQKNINDHKIFRIYKDNKAFARKSMKLEYSINDIMSKDSLFLEGKIFEI